MKKLHYIISVRNGMTTVYSLENLNQIYGLLIGKVETFQELFLDFKHFDSWWRRRPDKKKRQLSLAIEEKNVEILIENRY